MFREIILTDKFIYKLKHTLYWKYIHDNFLCVIILEWIKNKICANCCISIILHCVGFNIRTESILEW